MATNAATTAAAPRPLTEQLTRAAIGSAIVSLVVTALVAGLAVSRASAHVLSAGAVAAVVAAAAATGALVGWMEGLNQGALEVADGVTALACGPGCSSAPEADPWSAGRLWRAASVWAALAAVWALAGGALFAVALNGRPARWVAVFIALVGLTGATGVVVAVVARHRGAHGVAAVLNGTLAVAPVPLAVRGWRQVAFPLAISQALVNAGFGWLLFHDYGIRGHTGVAPLTRSVVLADVPVIVIFLAVIVHAVANRLGTVDALVGRVSVDHETPAGARPSPVGWQAVVYIGVLGVVLGRIAGQLLPEQPTLVDVCLARALFSGVMVFVVAGFAYVRGATNAATR